MTAAINNHANERNKRTRSPTGNFTSQDDRDSQGNANASPPSKRARTIIIPTRNGHRIFPALTRQHDVAHASIDGGLPQPFTRHTSEVSGPNSRDLRENIMERNGRNSSIEAAAFIHSNLTPTSLSAADSGGEKIEDVEAKNKKGRKYNPNAGRKDDSLNCGGKGTDKQRREQRPRYWALHDSLVLDFCKFKMNPKMVDYPKSEWLNDNGVPFTPTQFRSAKDLANPEKVPSSQSGQKRKRRIRQSVLAEYEARNRSTTIKQMHNAPSTPSQVPSRGPEPVVPNANPDSTMTASRLSRSGNRAPGHNSRLSVPIFPSYSNSEIGNQASSQLNAGRNQFGGRTHSLPGPVNGIPYSNTNMGMGVPQPPANLSGLQPNNNRMAGAFGYAPMWSPRADSHNQIGNRQSHNLSDIELRSDNSVYDNFGSYTVQNTREVLQEAQRLQRLRTQTRSETIIRDEHDIPYRRRLLRSDGSYDFENIGPYSDTTETGFSGDFAPPPRTVHGYDPIYVPPSSVGNVHGGTFPAQTRARDVPNMISDQNYHRGPRPSIGNHSVYPNDMQSYARQPESRAPVPLQLHVNGASTSAISSNTIPQRVNAGQQPTYFRATPSNPYHAGYRRDIGFTPTYIPGSRLYPQDSGNSEIQRQATQEHGTMVKPEPKEDEVHKEPVFYPSQYPDPDIDFSYQY